MIEENIKQLVFAVASAGKSGDSDSMRKAMRDIGRVFDAHTSLLRRSERLLKKFHSQTDCGAYEHWTECDLLQDEIELSHHLGIG